MKETGDKYRNFINLMIQEIDNVANCGVINVDFNGIGFRFKIFNKCNLEYYYFVIDADVIEKIHTRSQLISVVCACSGHIRAFVFNKKQNEYGETIPKIDKKVINEALNH